MYYLNRIKWGVIALALGLALWCTYYFTVRTNTLIKQDQASQLFELASTAIADQNDEEAVKLLHQVIELDPGMAIAYYQRGVAYFRLGNDNQSFSDVATASRLGFALADQWLEEHRTSSP